MAETVSVNVTEIIERISVNVTEGLKGDKGDDGADGINGIGVPTGGTTGQVLAKNSDTDYDAGWDKVGINNLADELKSVFTVTDVIDWNGGVTGVRTFTGTPTVVFTDTNTPTETKTITIDLTGEVTSIAFPSNYRKATNASEDYDGTKINKFTFEYVNGVVYYSNTLFDV